MIFIAQIYENRPAFALSLHQAVSKPNYASLKATFTEVYFKCTVACFFILAHHHPDWLVEITVARDTLCARCLAVIRVNIVVSMGIHMIPQVKPLV